MYQMIGEITIFFLFDHKKSVSHKFDEKIAVAVLSPFICAFRCQNMLEWLYSAMKKWFLRVTTIKVLKTLRYTALLLILLGAHVAYAQSSPIPNVNVPNIPNVPSTLGGAPVPDIASLASNIPNAGQLNPTQLAQGILNSPGISQALNQTLQSAGVPTTISQITQLAQIASNPEQLLQNPQVFGQAIAAALQQVAPELSQALSAVLGGNLGQGLGSAIQNQQALQQPQPSSPGGGSESGGCGSQVNPPNVDSSLFADADKAPCCPAIERCCEPE